VAPSKQEAFLSVFTQKFEVFQENIRRLVGPDVDKDTKNLLQNLIMGVQLDIEF
jgi:hypothetical protein